MSSTEEDQLLQFLFWSNQKYPLDKFLEDYKLPQVVRIEGHYEENEVTSLGTCQVLTLHALSSRKTLVGDDCDGKPLTVSLDCPVKVHVYPLERDQYPGVQDASGKTVDVFLGARYVKALEGYMNNETEDECFEGGDILEIMEIDKKNAIIRCRNMATNVQISYPFQCTTSFVPLLDHKEYTLAEVKEKFDVPVKVSFISAGDELSQSLSSFGIILLLGETDETVVIATTVGGTTEDKVYHILQKDLDVSVCVAEEILSRDVTYEQLTTKIHDDARVQKLFDLNQLADCRARRFVHSTRQDFLDHEPSKEVLQKHAEMRLRFTQPPRPPKPNKDHQSSRGSCLPPNSPCSSSGSPSLPPPDDEPLQKDKIAPRESESKSKTLTIFRRISGTFELVRSRQGRSQSLPQKASSNHYEKIDKNWRRSRNFSETRTPTKDYAAYDLSVVTVEDVGEILKDLRMERYVAMFEEEMIDGKMLKSLDEECLQSLDMNLYHCKKLIRFVNGLQPRAAAKNT